MLEFLRRNRLLTTAAIFLLLAAALIVRSGGSRCATTVSAACCSRRIAPSQRIATRTTGALANAWQGLEGLWRARLEADALRAPRAGARPAGGTARGGRAGECAPARAAGVSPDPHRRAPDRRHHRTGRHRTVAHHHHRPGYRRRRRAWRGRACARRDRGAGVPGEPARGPGNAGDGSQQRRRCGRAAHARPRHRGGDGGRSLRPQVREAHRGSAGRRRGGELRASTASSRAACRSGASSRWTSRGRDSSSTRRSSRRSTWTRSRRCWSRWVPWTPRVAGGRGGSPAGRVSGAARHRHRARRPRSPSSSRRRSAGAPSRLRWRRTSCWSSWSTWGCTTPAHGGSLGAFALGYLLDTFSGTVLGVHAFAFTLVYIGVHLVARVLWTEGGVPAVLVVLPGGWRVRAADRRPGGAGVWRRGVDHAGASRCSRSSPRPS